MVWREAWEDDAREELYSSEALAHVQADRWRNEGGFCHEYNRIDVIKVYVNDGVSL